MMMAIRTLRVDLEVTEVPPLEMAKAVALLLKGRSKIPMDKTDGPDGGDGVRVVNPLASFAADELVTRPRWMPPRTHPADTLRRVNLLASLATDEWVTCWGMDLSVPTKKCRKWEA